MVFAGREGVHHAHRSAAVQAGRDKIQTLGKIFAGETLLAAAVSAVLIGGLLSLFHHFEMLGQRAAHRFLDDALFDLGIDDHVLGRGELRFTTHFVDQGQLLIFNGQLLGSGAKQAVLERFNAQFEMTLFMAPILAELSRQSDCFLKGRRSFLGAVATPKPQQSCCNIYPYLLVLGVFICLQAGTDFTLISIMIGSLRLLCFRRCG